MAAEKKNLFNGYTNDELMAMDKYELTEFARTNGLLPELAKLFSMKSEKTVYPRKKEWDEEKQKYVYVADKDKTPKKKLSKLGFFEIKAKFLHDVCGLPYVEKEEAADSFENLVKAAMKAEAAKGE